MVTVPQDTQFTVTNEYNLYVPHEPYSPSELSAMSYHGVLRSQFGPYYVHVKTTDTASQRAKSVKMVGARLIRGDWTATLLTSAWIHLGGQAPELLEAGTAAYQKTPRRSRIMPAAFRHTDYLQRPGVSDEDLLIIGGVVVTGLELTIEDLLRFGSSARNRQRALDLACCVDLNRLEQRLINHRKLPGMDEARRHLDDMRPTIETLSVVAST